MNSLSVRATAVKNSNETDKTSDIRFMILKLPNTNVFNADNSTNDCGVLFIKCLPCLLFQLC